MDALKQIECNEKEVFGFCLTLFSNTDELHTLWIPETPRGFYRFSNESEYRFVNIEEKRGSWVVHCSPPAYFRNELLVQSNDIPLEDQQLLEIECEENQYYLYIQPVEKKQMSFQNYSIVSGTEICIGSNKDSDIYYDNKYCADCHAVLIRSDGKWHIRAIDEKRGVYVNCFRVSQAYLQLGDMIHIMGLRVIVGSNYLSISGTGCNVNVSPQIIKETSSHGSYFRYSGQEVAPMTEQFFHRLPRKRLELEKRTITVEGPPMSMDHAQMPLMLRMGSSMVMGGAAAMAGNFTTLLSSVLFPLLSSKYTDKQKKEYESCRVTKYHEYLDAKRTEIEKAGQEEHRIQNRKFPAIDEAIAQALQKQCLWERRPIDADFLTLRLGAGNLPMQTNIAYPERRFSLDSDPLEEEMYQMVEAEHVLTDMPITLSLTENTSCGLLGSREFVLSFIRQIMLQIAIFHSYDEVKMIFLAAPDELKQLEDIRFLPHVWDDQQSIRFVATNESEAYRIGEYLQSQLPEKLEDEKDLRQILKTRPYYVVFALDKKLFDSHSVLKDILQAEEPHGVSVISVYDNLPKECQKIIRLSLDGDGKQRLTSLEQNGGEDVFFSTDPCEESRVAKTMRMLANTKLKAVEQEQALPKMLTFLEMFRAGTVEQLNSFTRWKENNPVSSLSAPVGVSPDGSWFTLDLHEKRQGPHGLVAGMTGSGKSEFLISYILSMAVNYHPNEVAFVLIDYKGGGLAGAFENPVTGVKLPHLVGTITNLDGSTIQRSLMSIESELRRRQRVFNEVKSQLNEGTMDIYAYQKLFRAGKISEPMPHLFIISDEFAELKQQQPEFIDKLISAARIGRSLGVHLILATQKPSGVVNDQIRSNTKFRVCLRVQERSDSMDMLKRPEAAELTDTGRFYLQVGYNEYFAMGQSAWCGAAYEPQSVIKKQRDDAVEFLDITGQTVAKAKPKGKKVKTGTTQLVAVVKYLSDLAEKEGFVAQPLWAESLLPQIGLQQVNARFEKEESGFVKVVLGMVDDPANQRQFPLVVDIQHNRNLLIAGETNSGKTTFLQTLLYGLATGFSSSRVNFYILDFSSRNLSVFQKLPHCGAFLTDENENDISELLLFLKSVWESRRKLFADADVSSYDAYLEIAELPLIILAIDNLARIEEFKQRSKFFSLLEDIMSNGVAYGMRVVYTVNQINTCPLKLRRNSGTKIALRVRDRFMYSDILDHRCTYEPSDTPGRGMCVVEDSCCEFQAALAPVMDTEKVRIQVMREEFNQISQRSDNVTQAQRIKNANVTETYREFCAEFDLNRIPLGIQRETSRKIAIPLQQLNSASVYFGNELCVIPIINNLFCAFERENAQVFFVKRENGSILTHKDVDPIKLEHPEHFAEIECSREGISRLMDSLMVSIIERKKLRDTFCDTNKVYDKSNPESVKKWRKYVRKNSEPIFVVFESLVDAACSLDIETAGKLSAYFTSCIGYNIYFLACFYHDDNERIEQIKKQLNSGGEMESESSPEYIRKKELRHIWEKVRSTFNQERFSLLFGGRFHKQGIITLPPQYQEQKNPCAPSNVGNCLMCYRNEIYELKMICPQAEEDSDIDENSIIS